MFLLQIKMYCDGGCRGNGKAFNCGGYGVVLIYGDYIKKMCGYKADTTNNKMELLSVIAGLRALKKHNIDLHIYVDSNYVYSGITIWSKKWKQGNWNYAKKNGILNLNYWMEIDRLLALISNSGGCYTLHKVKGHSGDRYNELADKLANHAMNHSLNCDDVRDVM